METTKTKSIRIKRPTGSSSNYIQSKSIFVVWRFVLIAAPIWWLSGLSLFIYQLAGFCLLLALIHLTSRYEAPIYMPPSSLFLLGLILVYIFSLVIHAGTSSPSRIGASIYNLSFWIMGFCLTTSLANFFSISRAMKIFRSFAFFTSLIAVVAVVMFIVIHGLGLEELKFKTPLSFLIGFYAEAGLLRQTLEISLLSRDWFAASSRARFIFLAPYATAAGCFILMTLISYMVQTAFRKGMARASFFVLVGLNILAIVMTFSRTVLLGSILSFAVVFLMRKKQLFLWAFLLILGAFCLLPFLSGIVEWVLGLRAGSSEVRFAIYKATFNQLQGLDLIFGFGTKPRIYDYALPLGSHSTYVSLLMKTGIVGCSIFACFQAYLLWQCFVLNQRGIKNRKVSLLLQGLAWVIVFMSGWVITEDLDAPQLIAYAYFSFIGIFEGLRRRLIYES